jgi:hypothetical protein
MSDFVETRNTAVAVARIVLELNDDDLAAAIGDAERSLAVAPVVDPTLYMKAGSELEKQIKLLRILRNCRAELEQFRPTS